MSETTATPLVTVLMPVHNGASFVGEAIESILAQTFKDFELLIIDDGSTDVTPAVLEHYARLDPRIRLVRRDARGLVATLNEGIELARGEWIARMDADDIALPHRLEKQLAQVHRTGADFCGGAVECFGDWRTIWRYPQAHDACEAHLLFDVPFAHPAVIGRRTAFVSLGYNAQFTQGQDYDLWQRAWAQGYRFTNVADVVLRYRVHRNQVSKQKENAQRERAKAVRMRMWAGLLPEMDAALVELAADAITFGSRRITPLLEAFERLLRRYEGEARKVVLFNLFRTFCKNAGVDKRAVLDWCRLLSDKRAIPAPQIFFQTLLLWFISLFSINPDRPLFQGMRKLRTLMSLRRRGG
jgi:glycosyltransferase involved in cell wall biosynthesis